MEPWPNERLFDAWYLRDEPHLTAVRWPEQMKGWTTTEKERWGVLMVKRALFEHMDGCRIIHRGDCPVWVNGYDQSYQVQGDLDVAYEGRNPIVEVKAYNVAARLHKSGKSIPPCQGLDFPRRQDYLNEQRRTGRPFYVVWVWPDEEYGVSIRGERIDLLDWPAHAESLNRQRSVKGAKMVYWEISTLRTVGDLVADMRAWAGSPFQESLAIA